MAAGAKRHVRELATARRLVVQLAAGLVILLIVAAVALQTSPVSLREEIWPCVSAAVGRIKMTAYARGVYTSD
jgi:hypothetical protein